MFFLTLYLKLPLVEETRPANVVDSQAIIPQLKWDRDQFGFDVCAVIADSSLDSAKVLSLIIQELKAKTYITRNLRKEKTFLSPRVITISGWL